LIFSVFSKTLEFTVTAVIVLPRTMVVQRRAAFSAAPRRRFRGFGRQSLMVSIHRICFGLHSQTIDPKKIY
jgi:hypothetical protein